MPFPFPRRRFRPTRAGLVRTRRWRRDPAHLGLVQYAGDKLRARQAGRALATGDAFTQDAEDLPGQRMIDADQDKHLVDVERREQEPQTVWEARREEVAAALDQTLRDIADERDADAELAAEMDELDGHPGLGRLAYAAVLVTVGVILWPVDRTIAQVLPLGRVGQFILAIGIGVLTCVVGHLAGKKLASFVKSWPVRKDQPAQFWVDAVLLALLVAVPVVVLVLVGQLRTTLLQTVEDLTGNAIQAQPAKLNAALTALQLLAYLGAVVFAFIYAQGEKRRRLERRRRQVRRRVRHRQRFADSCEQYAGKVDRRLDGIGRRVELERAAIQAKRARRHARHDHALHRVRVKEKGRAAKQSADRDPLGVADFDVGALADEVRPELRTNHSGPND